MGILSLYCENRPEFVSGLLADRIGTVAAAFWWDSLVIIAFIIPIFLFAVPPLATKLKELAVQIYSSIEFRKSEIVAGQGSIIATGDGGINISIIEQDGPWKKTSKIIYREINSGGMRGSEEESFLTNPSGNEVKLNVWVMWDDSSWRSNGTTVNNEENLDRFLTGSHFRRELEENYAIICLGLVSNKMSDAMRDTEPDERENKFGTLSDQRAFSLCQKLAAKAKALNSNPKFVALGLGYSKIHTSDKVVENRQRSVVILGVSSTEERPIEKSSVDGIIQFVLEDKQITDFQPHQYSRIIEQRPICWSSLEQGEYLPLNSDCETEQ